MRIGIISKYYKNYNIGGQMQAYALTKVLENFGYTVSQISFKPSNTHKNGIVVGLKNYMRTFARAFFIHIRQRKWSSLNKNFRLFMNSIPHTKIYTEKNINECNEDFDAFIAGSDQIWNPSFWCDEYFLCFARKDKKKIAYAASMGVTELAEAERIYVKKMLADFNAISVRENEAKQLLQSITEPKPVKWVLDPTLLLRREDYDKILPTDVCTCGGGESYALIYIMGNDEDTRKTVDSFINLLDKELRIIPFCYQDYKKPNPLTGTGPLEFISLIRNADMVVTDSFHGTVFSIIYHKEFVCFRRDKVSDKKSTNSRVDSLLKMVGIQPRWINSFSDYKYLNKINWAKVDENLDKLRENSLGFLINAIEGDVRQ